MKNSSGVAQKVITCPMCKTQLLVKFSGAAAPQQPLEAHTVSAGSGFGGGDTHLSKGRQATMGDAGGGFANAPKTAYLLSGGAEYRLYAGENTVGRRAQTSQASVQIATDDHYMSRHHAIIRLVITGSGAIRATISNYKNQNPTTVNGSHLADGDEIILSPGNVIVMGNTMLTYNER